MKNFLKKQRELISVIVYVCIIGAIVNFVIMPILSEISTRRDEIQEEMAMQENQKKKIAELPAIKQQYLMVQNEGDALNVLVNTNDEVTLIETLEQLAKDTGNGITIDVSSSDPNSREAIIAQKNAAKDKSADDKSVSVVDTLPSKNYLELNISLTGQYQNIVDFMGKIENMRYYSDIISFDIKQDDSTNSPTARGTGMISPFSSSSSDSNMDKSANQQPVGAQKLVSALDVVFYLKQ